MEPPPSRNELTHGTGRGWRSLRQPALQWDGQMSRGGGGGPTERLWKDLARRAPAQLMPLGHAKCLLPTHKIHASPRKESGTSLPLAASYLWAVAPVSLCISEVLQRDGGSPLEEQSDEKNENRSCKK